MKVAKSAKAPRISNRIRDLRAETGMTQQELADRIGVTRQTVNAIEGDKYSPSLETAFRVAAVFGVPLSRCFSGGRRAMGSAWCLEQITVAAPSFVCHSRRAKAP